MATIEEIATLDLIQKKRKLVKECHLNVATQLSYGQERYRAAINTIISVGSLSVATSIIILIKELVNAAIAISQNGWAGLDHWTYILLILEIGVFITTIVLGCKLYKLDVTPTFALVSLIIILVANALLAIGIFPLITVVLAIIGLVRWSTFKSWFYNIDKKRRKMANQRKTLVNKTKKRSIALDHDEEELSGMMDKNGASTKSVGWMVAFIIAIIIAIGGSIGFYFLGRYQGTDDGKKEGYSSGYDTGYSIGHDDGYRAGFSGGEAASKSYYNQGYNDGYNDMWKKAMCIVSGGGASCN